MLKKIKNKKGSAMTLAIIVLLIVGIGGTVTTNMVINQMKSTQKNSELIDSKYETEAEVEKVIGEYIDKINAEGDKTSISDFDVLYYYVNIADLLIKDNSKPIKDAMASIKVNLENGILKKEDLESIYSNIGTITSGTGNSRPEGKLFLEMAKYYTELFMDNLFGTNSNSDSMVDLSTLTVKNCENMINGVLKNLSKEEFSYKEKGKTYTHYGNAGLLYRNIKFAENTSNNIDEIYIAFGSNTNTKFGEITGKIDSLLTQYNISNIDEIINEIKELQHEVKLEDEKEKVNTGNYLNTGKLLDIYKKISTGDVNDLDVTNMVKDEIMIVKLEINMLLQWLNIYKDLNSNTDSEGTVNPSEGFRITVPKEISWNNGKVVAKPRNVVEDFKDNPNITLINDPGLDIYIFEIKSAHEIVLNLDVNAEIENYKIFADVELNINPIMTEHTYDIDYKVKSWNKVN